MKLKLIFILSICGLAFSGYLSAIKLFTNTCAFSESCPYFLGYPACWYGFAMYFLMFVAVLFALLKQIQNKSAINTTLAISFVGILFSGRFVIDEIMRSQITGSLGLSTCAYGLIFYVLIFAISLFAYTRE